MTCKGAGEGSKGDGSHATHLRRRRVQFIFEVVLLRQPGQVGETLGQGDAARCREATGASSLRCYCDTTCHSRPATLYNVLKLKGSRQRLAGVKLLASAELPSKHMHMRPPGRVRGR